MPNIPCWKHCLVLRRVHIRVCHLTSLGRLPTCAPIAFAYVDLLEAHTFGARYIYTVLRRRMSWQDKPFCAERPFSTEGDEEKRAWWWFVCDGHHAHIGNQRGGSTHAPHMKTSVRLQAAGVAMICKMGTNHLSLLGAKTCEKPDDHE